MFHHTRNTLTHSYLRKVIWTGFAVFLGLLGLVLPIVTAADEPEHPASFDPTKGFKPAQSDLTEVFLQIAGSLEYYGSPEPYLQHMKAEHARIEAKYQQQLGDKPRSFCPAYMDAAYFDRLAANWKHIAPQLGLESLAKNTGHLMQIAINGPNRKGTILVEVFNEHQHQVYAGMANKKAMQIPDFDSLKTSMVKCLRLEEPPVNVQNLTAEKRAAVDPAKDIQTAFLRLFSALDAGLPATAAVKVKAVISSIVIDVGRMAQSELEAASLEASLDVFRALQTPYSAEQETALNTEEQKILADFLKKKRFTKADFPALDKFYSGPYDKLSERGREELSHRFWDGIHRPR